jgi:purine-binding chemotaxis protein CheW
MSVDQNSASGETKSFKEARYLSFTLGKEDYAIPLLSVKEVIAPPEITPVPHTPNYFMGIMNLRGQVISVLDLRVKLSIKPSDSSETAVIICDLGGLSLGVMVDAINAVLNPKPSEISDKPEIHSTKNTEYITGVYRKDNRLILFLDIARSLEVQDHAAIQKGMKKAA